MKVVYTYIFDNHDWLLPPVVTKGWRYVCFTDTPDSICKTQDVWEIIKVPLSQDTPKRTAGYYLTHGLELFPECDTVVSVSGQYRIVGFLDGFVDGFLKRDYCIMNHPVRNCTYQEGKAVLLHRRDVPRNINPQLDRYRKEGLPPNSGMVQTGAIGRKNILAVKEFELLWWEEIRKGSQRDQLSFNYTLWKNPHLLKIDYFNEIDLVPYMKLGEHRICYDDREYKNFISDNNV